MWSSKPVIQKNLIFLSFQNQYFIYLKKLDEEDRDYIDNIINLIDKG